MIFENKKILVVGASSDLAVSLNEKLYDSGATIGFHYNKNKEALSKYRENEKVKKIQKDLNSAKSCYEVVDEFVKWADGIDCLVQLAGDIKRPVPWEQMTEEEWFYDLSVNLLMPFFLAQRSISRMRQEGRVVLMSTASAAHGGGRTSLAYGVAKAGVECVVKRLAKDCAARNILINAVAPGFIMTKFHTEKMKRTHEQLEERTQLVPLKRCGTPTDVAGTILFLLSDDAAYITGEVIAVSGGEWL